MRIAISTLAAITVAGAAVAGATALAAAEPSGSADGRTSSGGTSLHLLAETDQFEFVDGGAPGPSLGDRIVSSDRLSLAGRQIGVDGSTCTVVRTTATTLTCSWVMTLALPRGQISLQGIAEGPLGPPQEAVAFDLAVTGGTGAYHAAHGQARVVDTGQTERITVRLR